MAKKQKVLACRDKKEQKKKLKDEKYFEKYGILKSEIVNNKEKFKIKYVWKMLKYLKGCGKSFATLIILMLLIIAIDTAMPIFLSNLVDSAIAQDYKNALMFALLYSIYLFSGPIWLCFDIIISKLSAKLTHSIRMDIVKSCASSKIEYFDKVSSGTILSRVNSDPDRFMAQIANILRQISSLLKHTAISFVFFLIDWRIGVFVFICLVILYILNTTYYRKVIVPAEFRSMKISDKYDSQSSEMIRGIRDIKNLNIFTHFYDKFKSISRNKRNSDLDTAKKTSVYEHTFAWNGAQNFFEVGVILLALYLLCLGDISIGQFSTVIMYGYAPFSIVHRIGYIKGSFMNMEISARRMHEIIDDALNEKESFGNLVLENAKGDIEFKDVGFSYKDESVFENLNLKINAGECVGIVGRSGEGKSTILSMISRIYDANSGSVQIDGIDVKELTQDSLRETVSVVSQNPYIFNLTIRENLKLVKPNATDEEIENACKCAVIWDFIQSKPEGLDIIVGEGGVVLSGGQKQRLAIARAFLKGSRILILDEATSALDNESQFEVKRAIKNIKNQCTIVIVAHRLSTVQDCDKIFVLKDHKIAGCGSHLELKENCEVYKNLYKQEDA